MSTLGDEFKKAIQRRLAKEKAKPESDPDLSAEDAAKKKETLDEATYGKPS